MTQPSIASQIEAAERAVLLIDTQIQLRDAIGDPATLEMRDWLQSLRQGLKTLRWVSDNADLLRELARQKREKA